MCIHGGQSRHQGSRGVWSLEDQGPLWALRERRTMSKSNQDASGVDGRTLHEDSLNSVP